eukprot:PhF_6_TR23836/c0_g1_i1/m.33421/K17914/KIF13; kinesin family member 13
MEEGIKVFARVRPFVGNEATFPDKEGRSGFPVIEERNNTQTCLLDPLNTYRPKQIYDFDQCWGIDTEAKGKPPAGQAEIFSAVGPKCITYGIEGMNSSILTFGASGCGKSYTLFGTTEQPGLLPRIVQSLVEWKTKEGRGDTATITATLVEISMERVHDLFAEGHNPPELKIRDEGKGPFLPSVTTLTITDADSFSKKVIKIVKNVYAHAPVRPHVILTVMLDQSFEFIEGTAKLTKRRNSRMTFVDLAPTDRASESVGEGAPPVQLSAQDVAKNNKALFTLRRCIDALGEKDGKSKPPFRDSVLTWLLSDSIGGNCSTNFILCLSPFHKHLTESQSTLTFGAKAKTVLTKVRVNEDEETIRLREMKNEMSGLTQQLTNVSTAVAAVTQQLQERSDKIESLSSLAQEQSAVLKHETKKYDLAKTVSQVISMRFKRRLDKLQGTFDSVSSDVEKLREEVRLATEQRQSAESSLREQEQLRFRECGIEQDILSCIQQIESSMSAVAALRQERNRQEEIGESDADADAAALTELRSKLAQEKSNLEKTKRQLEEKEDEVKEAKKKGDDKLRKLRDERDRLLGVHNTNASTIADAQKFITETEKEIERLKIEKSQLLSDNAILKSGCQCLLM